jgi:hypothetical protein
VDKAASIHIARQIIKALLFQRLEKDLSDVDSLFDLLESKL